MKYRHSFHAGNFADVHKHVTLLALLAALKRKDKGFLYLETHAGRGAYYRARLRQRAHEAEAGIERIAAGHLRGRGATRTTSQAIAAFRTGQRSARLSRLARARGAASCVRRIAASPSRSSRPEARALELRAGHGDRSCAWRRGDGFERLRAHLPPAERRGLTFIDPPYEETRRDFDRVTAAVERRAAPFRERRGVRVVSDQGRARHQRVEDGLCRARSKREVLFSELWLYPRDSRVGLNGSGLAIVNPPYQIDERMQVWLPELYQHLDAATGGGTSVPRRPKRRFRPGLRVERAQHLPRRTRLASAFVAAQHRDAAVARPGSSMPL